MPLPQVIHAEELGSVLNAWVDEIHSLNYEPALRECVPVLHEDFEDHFIAELGDNGPWAPRTRQYYWPILIKTGKLIESVRDTGHPDNITRVDSNTLETGSIVNYAAFHQYGTRFMVARPFVWASEEALDECVKRFGDFVFNVIAN